ncbi:hypothetical protein K5549_020317 [Capra hircus]|uniref:Ubiquitin-like domain-containing protein n=1 Tax=Capra hircus TaxID=9925 RepID=A0A452EXT1_CAPHI|nr:hypothetical protein K5549_020317 [Capra hircus]
MNLFVLYTELHTLKVTGQETVTQIKAHLALLEEDQVLLLAGTPLEDEVTLGQCGVEALSTLEVAGRMPGGKVHGSLDCAGKVTGQTPKRKRRRWGQAKTFVPTFGKKSPSANSKSSVILAFSNKAISPNQKNKQNKTMQTMHGDSM